MYVLKRDGRREPVQFDKITARIKKLCYGLHDAVDPTKVAMRVIEGVYDGVTTTELDNLAAEVAATNAVTHPDYAQLASRIAVSNLHKATKKYWDTLAIHRQGPHCKNRKTMKLCLIPLPIDQLPPPSPTNVLHSSQI